MLAHFVIGVPDFEDLAIGHIQLRILFLDDLKIMNNSDDYMKNTSLYHLKHGVL